MIATLELNGQSFPVNPTGLAGIKTTWQRQSEHAFYRKKLSGSVEFSASDFDRVEALQDCCSAATLSVFSFCSKTTPSIQARLKSNKFAWNFALCTAKTDSLEVNDLYTGVYAFWEKKVNILSLPANLTVLHTYGDKQTVGDQVIVTRKNASNKRFRTWNTFIPYLIRKTFTDTIYASIIPSDTEFSLFFTAGTNPVDLKPNLFRRAAIVQASDAMTPNSTQSATGLLEKGGDNESMSMSLKEVLEFIYAAFDCHWFIDPQTGKFRIEHQLYFDKGFSYDAPQTGIDLRYSRYHETQKSYHGSYKIKTEELYGIEELIMEGNQALNKSKSAYPLPFIETPEYLGFGIIDDFEFGNIRYDTPCASRDEKGQLVRNSRTASLFYTMLDGIAIGDEAIDLTKWFLVEYVLKTLDLPDRFGGRKTYGLFGKGFAERRNVDSVTNAEFSATALMRSFHRHGRSFQSGLMNYDDKISVPTGVVRQMLSVKSTKEIERIVLPYCCDENEFQPHKLVTLPDGQIGRVSLAELSGDRLSLDLLTSSACAGEIISATPGVPVEYEYTVDPVTGFPIVRPPTGGGKNPVFGTLLRTEEVEVMCTSWFEYPGGPSNEVPTMTKKYTYADGLGGEYIEQANPCNY